MTGNVERITVGGTPGQIVELIVAETHFAIPLGIVDRVIAWQNDGENSPAGEEGMSAVAAEEFLGMEVRSSGGLRRGVILRSGASSLILIVDRVIGTRTIEADALRPSPDRLPARTRKLVRGIIESENGPVLVVLAESALLSAIDSAARETEPR